MCGIVCAFDLKQSSEDLRPQVLDNGKKYSSSGTRLEWIFMQ